MRASNNGLIGAVLAMLVTSGFSAPTVRAPSHAPPVKERTLKTIEPHDRARFAANYDVNGAASWYGAEFDGRLDARGERFDSTAMTAAHRTLPLNSMVMVTNLENGRQVRVRITDRGPYAHHRIIDLSRAAADALGYTAAGAARVNVRALSTQ